MLKKILVLDDNQDILEIVHETLTYENFEVKSITKGEDVFPTLQTFAPDLVILDYRVSGANGGEICRQIKSDPRYSTIPVIIFSAYIGKINELFEYGCNAIINKPFDLTELVEKVNGLVAS